MSDNSDRRNIFHLDNPDGLKCRVVSFSIGHSILTIGVENDTGETVAILKFASVEFLSLPVVWEGANFELRDAHEFVLYPRNLSSVKVSVFASNAYRLDEEGQDLRFAFDALNSG